MLASMSRLSLCVLFALLLWHLVVLHIVFHDRRLLLHAPQQIRRVDVHESIVLLLDARSSIPAMPLVFNSTDSAAILVRSSAEFANAADADRLAQTMAARSGFIVFMAILRRAITGQPGCLQRPSAIQQPASSPAPASAAGFPVPDGFWPCRHQKNGSQKFPCRHKRHLCSHCGA